MDITVLVKSYHCLLIKLIDNYGDQKPIKIYFINKEYENLFKTKLKCTQLKKLNLFIDKGKK